MVACVCFDFVCFVYGGGFGVYGGLIGWLFALDCFGDLFVVVLLSVMSIVVYYFVVWLVVCVVLGFLIVLVTWFVWVLGWVCGFD